jgi:ATP synthase F0 subunit b
VSDRRRTVIIIALVATVGVLLAASCPAFASEAGHPAFNWKKEALRTLNFLILMVGVYYLFKLDVFDLGKIVKHFKERPAKVEKIVEEAKAAKAEAEAKRAEYEAKIARAEQEVAEISAVADSRVEAMRAELAQAAEAAAQKVGSDAEERIAAEVNRARAELQREASLLAIELSEEIIKEHLNEEDQQKLVDAAIEKLEGLK